jgi:hypothetical protein
MILGFILLGTQMTQAQKNWSTINDSAGESLGAHPRNKAWRVRVPAEHKHSSGEKKAEFSVDIFSGATSIVTDLSLNNNGNYQYHYTPTFGFAGDLGYSLSSRLAAHASVGYLQRGAEFNRTGFSGQSRYQLSYIDLWGYLEYATGGRTKFTFLTGLSESTLIAAKLTSSSGKIDVMNDFNKIDVGFVAGPGILLSPTKNKIRVRVIFSYGFRDAFAEGHFNNNDIKAHNHAYLVQVGYIFN